jgi:hypothetical protein
MYNCLTAVKVNLNEGDLMLKVLKFAMIALVVLVLCPKASEAGSGRNFGQIYTECGLGGMIFQNQKWAGLAAVSNILWDWGTTASSSEITTPDSCMGGKEDKMAAFIYHSYDSLENDLAKGYGDHLDTLMVLAGKTQSDATFVESLRQDLAGLVADPAYTTQTQYQKAEALFNIVEKNNTQVS